uniref:Si:ch211-91p5.3 n=1 Tax=Cyprinus carpio TaxID=7962 RepID=A0A8C2E0P0_CYPCA
MSSTQSYSRFSDENYKNWLKTTESLYILRSRIQDFIEKETETYHNSLRNKPHLNGQTCTRSCKLTNKPVCQSCEYWKNEIIANHNGKGNSIHWDNCRPNLWPTDKWEVAKAHMPRGHNKHCKFDQFDIAAILNLMYSCKHFKNIPGKSVVDVISVRNQMMHSPDFKVSNEDMEKHHKTVLQLAEKLQPHIPEMKDLEKKITQFHNTLDKNFNQAPCEVDGQLEDLQTMKDFQKVLDREQQAIKDRIEDFFSRFEGNQDENVKDMKSLMDFLDQNKDLLENLGPEVDKLKEMKAKVDEHEEQINNLTGRVDQLEKVTHDPVIPGNLLRYKNHLYEYCQSKKWPEVKFPVFTEDQESQGYRGKVTVNGQSFIGRKVFNDKKAAHQEVAYIALELLKLQEESTDEPSSSVIQPDASSSSSSGIPFFGKVTVDLDREVVSDRCSSKEEATEAAYKVLWESFRISAPVEGQTYKSVTMEYFNTNGFPKPLEDFDDNTTICKLKLVGLFNFYDKDGSTKKKHAEQQAAKVALQHLSGILNYAPISDTEKNFKGVLKERLEMLGLKNPVYDTDNKAEASEEPINISSDLITSTVSISQAEVKDHTESEIISSSPSCQESVRVPVPVQPDPPDSSSPASQREKPRNECPGITFFSKVTVDLNQEVVSDRCSSKEEATEAAYKVLSERFHICAPAEAGQTYRTGIMEYFNIPDLQKPTEEFFDDENTTVCKLKLNGPLIFYDKDGSTKKKYAEQQAAKVALQHLSGILNCAPISDTEQNFKGVLKERLEMLGLKNPIYETEEYKAEASEEPVTSGISTKLPNLSINQEAVKEHLDLKSESISTSAQPPSGQEPVHVPVPVQPDSPASQRKKSKIDCPEIDELVNVYNLKPPHVNVENMKYDQNVKCTVTINLEKCTCANKQGYDSKKEAIRKAYLLFGCAVGILDPSSDEKTCSALVKQHFSQRSLILPQEDVEGSVKPFYCSLKNITYDVRYDGQGSSEGEAKLLAFQNALRALSPLFDYASLPGADSPEEVQNQLSSMLNGAGQKEPVTDLKSMEQASIQLSFCDYTLKCTCQSSKKAARNHLSERILGLLGVKTDNNASLRNSLDEWFKKQNLPKPVFEDIEEALGAKATFSVQLTCCCPGWEDSWETAKSKLLQELKLRFRFLNDKNN